MSGELRFSYQVGFLCDASQETVIRLFSLKYQQCARNSVFSKKLWKTFE